MRWISRSRAAMSAVAISVLLAGGGCTSFRDYVHNGFKVGPNYGTPPAPVAEHWIDANDVRVREASNDLSRWWTVFNDPVLNSLIDCAYQQNLSLRDAGFRVLQARAQLAITQGNLFPQNQAMSGSYVRSERSLNPPTPAFLGDSRFSSQWSLGFNLDWNSIFGAVFAAPSLRKRPHWTHRSRTTTT